MNLEDTYQDQCILWQGSKCGAYGRTHYIDGKRYYAHHYAWFLKTGRMPKIGWHDGKYWVVAHKCDVKMCVNPEHIENVTQNKNMQDARARGLRKPLKMNEEQRARCRASQNRPDLKKIRAASIKAHKPWQHRWGHES